MDAQLYPPANHWVAPVRQPHILNTRDASIADLMALQDVWAMLLKEAPGIAMMTSTPMLKPHLGNMSLRDLVMFGAMKGDALDRVDARLRDMGPMK
ncbi:MAG: hypothetical protein KGQ42_03910 [Alphaproteobacteria bacterium]|nr:hypothetical protein [Alphaproteobacteria bacterium]MDE2041450.1 hypothetical protein [Alphaproteobacteria bacterium]MDE2339520.1 hypothetical protein [Alphaproteobacteria bacterium]